MADSKAGSQKSFQMGHFSEFGVFPLKHPEFRREGHLRTGLRIGHLLVWFACASVDCERYPPFQNIPADVTCIHSSASTQTVLFWTHGGSKTQNLTSVLHFRQEPQRSFQFPLEVALCMGSVKHVKLQNLYFNLSLGKNQTFQLKKPLLSTTPFL